LWWFEEHLKLIVHAGQVNSGLFALHVATLCCSGGFVGVELSGGRELHALHCHDQLICCMAEEGLPDANCMHYKATVSGLLRCRTFSLLTLVDTWGFMLLVTGCMQRSGAFLINISFALLLLLPVGPHRISNTWSTSTALRSATAVCSANTFFGLLLLLLPAGPHGVQEEGSQALPQDRQVHELHAHWR
jgi:hypothetical protein